ncbi:hypothetical protein M8C21_029546 [Ambrosia artemisiifolia]|uniref:Ubiquinol oxidase n=1 Tax=Ambrosia artemisiifolia TaxID=4212 RepID=A0AAD5GX64_AMBAR|nr:hypothetical protein M8C21_029546 [Ambrosia artemisiifolia]
MRRVESDGDCDDDIDKKEVSGYAAATACMDIVPIILNGHLSMFRHLFELLKCGTAQARRVADIDEKTDVWSLGCTLCYNYPMMPPYGAPVPYPTIYSMPEVYAHPDMPMAVRQKVASSSLVQGMMLPLPKGVLLSMHHTDFRVAESENDGSSDEVSPLIMGQWPRDERELKRQKRKQSNRESARRSRMHNQAMKGALFVIGLHLLHHLNRRKIELNCRVEVCYCLFRHPEQMRRRYGCRAMMLETVAAVPGMVGGMLLHLRSLRKFQQSGGWIKALLEEAENERMHLMTMVELVKPKWYERLLVLTVQGVFFNAFCIIYILSPKLAHRIVGYLEEEAIHSYTEFLKDIESGAIENVPAPAIAIDYWRLPKDSTLKEVITVIRADEAHHRDVNHFASDIYFQGKELREAPAPVGYH